MQVKSYHYFFIFILFTCLLAGTYSCKSSDDNPFITKYSVKGRLLSNCDSRTPIQHKLIYLETAHNSGITHNLLCEHGYKEVATAYTNSNGEFELRYKQQNCIGYMQISIADTVKDGIQHLPIVTYIRGNEDATINDAYISHTKKYTYNIKTQQPYTTTDTIYYNLNYFFKDGKRDSTYSFVVGPFTNGQELNTFSFTGDKQIHDIGFALANDRYNVISIWMLKSNGLIKKSKHEKRLLSEICTDNFLSIELDN